jgi:hypothetical protein
MAKHKYPITIFLFFILSIFLIGDVLAATKASVQPQVEAVQSVGVSAFVESPVSKDKSKIETSAKETLADPASHSILLSVTLSDKDGKAISDKKVEAYSNRGSVDIIEAISKLPQYKAQASDVSDMQHDQSDSNGLTNFRVTSFVPGEAILSVVADNVVNLGSTKITFLPLPFPANITISVGLPGQKEWTLISPQEQENNLSLEQKAAKSLVNTGTKFQIPFWIFVLLVLWFCATPIALIIMIGFFAKIRKVEGEEFSLLKNVAEAKDLNTLRGNLKGHRIISRGWR